MVLCKLDIFIRGTENKHREWLRYKIPHKRKKNLVSQHYIIKSF